ncbi:MAG TPA: 5-deoxy-glucuronate isomerase [Bellilinea sp.]|nr:5-deoxy-glucuronate isomerase [Bellilinea sp.]
MGQSKLLIKPDYSRKEYIRVTPESAGWENLSFTAVKLQPGETWQASTGENEMALVILTGSADIASNVGEWRKLGSRKTVFDGYPTTLFVSRGTDLTVTAAYGEVKFACGMAKANRTRPPVLVKPGDCSVELRGGGNASRQIVQMMLPGFPSDRLVAVEVFTPSGNWSSYPPHKHDERVLDENGKVLEADLEEIYFYQVDKPEGFAYQRIYTPDRSIDDLILVQHDDLVLSPEGYHPVVAAPGYNVYYLNFLAGSDQSLTARDDPDYAWVKQTFDHLDPRVPFVHLQKTEES